MLYDSIATSRINHAKPVYGRGSLLFICYTNGIYTKPMPSQNEMENAMNDRLLLTMALPAMLSMTITGCAAMQATTC